MIGQGVDLENKRRHVSTSSGVGAFFMAPPRMNPVSKNTVEIFNLVYEYPEELM